MTQARWISTATLILLASTLSVAGPAMAQTKLGAFKDWTSYTHADTRGKICYAAAQPKTTAPDGVNRNPIFLMVTTRPADKVQNEISVLMGYPLKANSKVSVDVDGKQFSMFTKEDGAWVENVADESVLITAFKGGSNVTIKGTSRRGTNTTDTYSLAGISAALDSISKACP